MWEIKLRGSPTFFITGSEPVLVGRDAECPIKLFSSACSRKHGAFLMDASSYNLNDPEERPKLIFWSTGSRSVLNNVVIKKGDKHTLHHGDTLLFGNNGKSLEYVKVHFKPMVICTTNLPSATKKAIKENLQFIGAHYSDKVTRQVTHLVTVKRLTAASMKLVDAVILGIRIVSYEFLVWPPLQPGKPFQVPNEDHYVPEVSKLMSKSQKLCATQLGTEAGSQQVAETTNVTIDGGREGLLTGMTFYMNTEQVFSYLNCTGAVTKQFSGDDLQHDLHDTAHQNSDVFVLFQGKLESNLELVKLLLPFLVDGSVRILHFPALVNAILCNNRDIVELAATDRTKFALQLFNQTPHDSNQRSEVTSDDEGMIMQTEHSEEIAPIRVGARKRSLASNSSSKSEVDELVTAKKHRAMKKEFSVKQEQLDMKQKQVKVEDVPNSTGFNVTKALAAVDSVQRVIGSTKPSAQEFTKPSALGSADQAAPRSTKPSALDSTEQRTTTSLTQKSSVETKLGNSTEDVSRPATSNDNVIAFQRNHVNTTDILKLEPEQTVKLENISESHDNGSSAQSGQQSTSGTTHCTLHGFLSKPKTATSNVEIVPATELVRSETSNTDITVKSEQNLPSTGKVKNSSSRQRREDQEVVATTVDGPSNIVQRSGTQNDQWISTRKPVTMGKVTTSNNESQSKLAKISSNEDEQGKEEGETEDPVPPPTVRLVPLVVRKQGMVVEQYDMHKLGRDFKRFRKNKVIVRSGTVKPVVHSGETVRIKDGRDLKQLRKLMHDDDEEDDEVQVFDETAKNDNHHSLAPRNNISDLRRLIASVK